MIYCLYFIVLFMNFICIWTRKESKVITGITLATIWFIWCGNSNGPDMINYLYRYKTILNQSFEIENIAQSLFFVSMWIGKKCSLTFYEYREIMTAVLLLVEIAAIRRLTNKVNVVLFLYLTAEFFVEGVQLRNFFALPFLMWGTVFIVEKKPHWRPKFAVAIMGAFLFHVSFLIYFVYLLIPENLHDMRKLKRWLLYAVGAFAFFFVAKSNLAFILNILQQIDKTRAVGFSQSQTRLGPLVPFVLQFYAVAFLYYITVEISKIKKVVGQNELIQNDEKKIRTFLWISAVTCFLLPFSLLNLTYYRLIRNTLLIVFCGIAIGSRYLNRRAAFHAWVAVYIAMWVWAEFEIFSGYENIVTPLFEYRMF